RREAGEWRACRSLWRFRFCEQRQHGLGRQQPALLQFPELACQRRGEHRIDAPRNDSTTAKHPRPAATVVTFHQHLVRPAPHGPDRAGRVVLTEAACMSWRTTAALFVVLLLVAAVALWQSRSGSNEAETPTPLPPTPVTENPFRNATVEDVTRLDIK